MKKCVLGVGCRVLGAGCTQLSHGTIEPNCDEAIAIVEVCVCVYVCVCVWDRESLTERLHEEGGQRQTDR